MTSREETQRINQVVDKLKRAKSKDDGSNQQLLLTYMETFMGIQNPGSLSDQEGIAQAIDAFAQLAGFLEKTHSENSKLQKQLKESSPQKGQAKGLDFNQMADAEKKIVKIQAFFRKQLTLKHLQQKINDAKAALSMKQELESPEEGALREFANQLVQRKITPEGFYRICDPEYKQNIRVETFKEQVKKVGIILSRGQLSRLIMILDEDLEGHISREEYYNALEAYNVSGEKHKSLDSSPYYPFEHKVLFKLISELRRKDISYIEMFNACDVNDDARVDIKEVRRFVEGLSPDFKFKEVHALMNHLDIDKNGILDKDEFVRQCTKGEQIFRQSQMLAKSMAEEKMRTQQNKQQDNNFFDEVEMDKGDQNFLSGVMDKVSNTVGKVTNTFSKSQPAQAKKPQAQQPQQQQTLSQSQSNVNLNPDEQKRKTIIQKMEREGQNFQSFFDLLRNSSTNGYISLGQVLKNIESSYPTISANDRNFLIKDCIVQRNKIDYLKLEEIFTKYSQKLRPSVSQTFSVIAQNIVKKMGSTPTDSIRLFLKAQNISESDVLSSIDFNKMFSGKFSTLSQLDLDSAFNSLNLDMDGFVHVRDLVQVLMSYLTPDEKTTLSIKDLSSVIPNIDSLSPRTRCEQIIEYLIQELSKKGMKPLNVYKMADTKNAGTISATTLEATFTKFLPHVKKEIFIEAMNAFRKTGKTQVITREDFETVFSESASKFIPHSSSLPTKKETPSKQQQNTLTSSKGFSDDDDSIKWIKKLDNVMLREGLSPTVAFKAADINHNGVITVDELRETMKKLIPEDMITLAELKKIMLAFDQNRNGLIEEEEFIQIFEKARNASVTVVQSPEKDRIMNTQMDDFRKSKLPLKDSVKATSQQEDTVDETDLMQCVQKVDKKVNLKKFFADVPINEQGMQMVTQIGRKFKSEQATDGSMLKPSEYLPIIKSLDKGTGLVQVRDIFKFCEKFCPSYMSDISLELKYLANFLEYQKNNKNTKQYLTTNTKLKPAGRIMEIELMSELNNHFGIPMNIGRILHQTLTKSKGSDIHIDDLCTFIDQYRTLKIENIAATSAAADTDTLFLIFTIKLLGETQLRRKEIDQMIQDAIQSEGAIYFNSFYKIFVEEVQVLTQKEAKALFEQWKTQSKTKNSIDLVAFQRVQNAQMAILKDYQTKALQKVMLEKGKPVFDGLAKVKMNEQGYVSKTSLKEYLQANEVIQRKLMNPQDTLYITTLKSQIGVQSDFELPQALQASEFLDQLLQSQSENCTIWSVVDTLASLTNYQFACDELIFKFLGKVLDALIPNKPSQTIVQTACPECASINDAKSLFIFIQKVTEYAQKRIDNFNHGAIPQTFSKLIELLYKEIGGKPFRINDDTNPLLQKVNRHRALLPLSKSDALNDSINQRVSMDQSEDATLIQHIEAALKQPIENALQDKDLFYEEQIPITSFLKLLISINPQFDRNLSTKLFSKVDTGKVGRIDIYNLVQFLKKIPGKYSKEEVISRIALQVQDPAQKYLESQGIKGSEHSMKSDVIAHLEELANISAFHSVCLFYDYLASPDEEKIQLQGLIDDIVEAKNPNKKQLANNQQAPTKVQGKASYKDKLRQKNMQLMKQILDELRKGMNDPKKNSAMLNLFESNNGKVEIDDFFDFLIDTLGSTANENQQDKLELLVDPNRKGRVKITDFVVFCEEYEINFKTDIQRYKTIAINKGEEKGDKVQIDDFQYTLVPERDFYRGVPTILNSQEAAIAQAHRLIRQTKGPKFLDTDFGPKDEDNRDQQGNKKSLYFTGEAPKGYCLPEEIVWIRPEKITKETPQFFSGDAGCNDVKQGQIGDCWFIGALSVIATRDELLRGGVSTFNEGTMEVDENMDKFTSGVVPPLFHLYRIKGMYVIRFFKEFQWRYVIIDDRIPCYKQNSEPVFGRCTDLHELWVPLIEKAYAKIHGCYETLISGFIDDALNDLTGLVAEKIKTHNDQGIFPHKSIGDKEKFWEYLKSRRTENCMMGCSVTGDVEREVIIDGFRTGIMTGHAYGILDVFELEDPNMVNPRKTHRLLRVRNPWGKMEWKGKWSDSSEELSNSKKLFDKYMASLEDEEKFDPFAEDGSFFICYSDWRDIYNNIFVCVDFPNEWTGVRFSSAWTNTCSGGTPSPMTEENKLKWAKNPQYLYETARDTEVFISLAQPDGRMIQPDGKYLKFPYTEVIHPVCFTVCQIQPTASKVTIFDKTQVKFVSVLKEHREVSLRMKLPKGKYVIVPSTRNPGETGTFYLSIYFNQKIRKIKELERIDQEEQYDMIKEEEEAGATSCPDWLIDLVQKRLPYMMGGDDTQLNESILNSSLLKSNTMRDPFAFEEEKVGHGTQSFMGSADNMKSKKTVKFEEQSSSVSQAARNLTEQFIENYNALTTSVIQSALQKIIGELRNIKTIGQALQILSPQGKEQVVVDELYEQLSNIQGLNTNEKYVITFIPVDQYQIENLTLDIKSFIQTLRQQKLDNTSLSQFQTVLKNNYEKLQPIYGQQKMKSQKTKRRDNQSKRRQDRIQRRKEELAEILTALQRGLANPQKKKLLIDYFESKNGALSYTQFFDFLVTNFNATEDEHQQEELSEEIDVKGTSKIKLTDFYAFCQEFGIQFEADIQRFKTKEIVRSGEALSVGGLTYSIVPSEDYFRGIPTILNSEQAALVIAEKLYNSLQDGEAFFDKDFGPKNEDDENGNMLSLYCNGTGPKGYRKPEDITWLRPSDFCNQKPQFVDDGAGANDVRQGEIGDCWLIGALSVLATRDELLRGAVAKLKNDFGEEILIDKQMAFDLSKGVYPPIFHMYRKKGIYILRFFKEFKWRYVIIDDRLPCAKTNGQPVFGKCKNVHELWVPLVEKAYAKLHGCYETLISGFIDDGLTDLTGLVAEKLVLHDQQGLFPHKSIKDKDTFWSYLMERRKENCMMGCSVSGDVERQIMVDGRPSGIMTGHAYGIIDVFELSDKNMTNPRKTHRLLRVRNPWGKMEWKGKWSDNSQELEKYSSVLYNYTSKQPLDEQFEPGVEDGTFLMCYSDWRDIYNNIFVCIDFPESWNGVRFDHEWNAQNSGGTPSPMTDENRKKWAKNPQFLFAPRKPVELFVSLAQPDGRAKRDDGKYHKFPYSEIIHPVCFTIVQLKEGQERADIFDKTQVKHVSILKEHREISLRVSLPKGRFVIVPATRNSGEYGPFTLSLYFNTGLQKVDIKCVDDESLQGRLIAEETENYENVPEWKVDLVQDRLQYMIGDEDEMGTSFLNTSQKLNSSGAGFTLQKVDFFE